MKKLQYIIVLLALLLTTSCADFLDLEPRDKVPSELLFSDPKGVEMYMANLYSRLPIEDYNININKGGHLFNLGIGGLGNADANNGGFIPAHMCDEAVHAEFNDWSPDEAANYWEDGYKLVRDINTLFVVIPDLDIKDVEKTKMLGEAHFLRAYTYFALAKRFGGLSIIEFPQYSNAPEELKVPRSTEKATWDFILKECDQAIGNLEFLTDTKRASKGIALALKSRAALYAGSIAKYTHAPYLTLVGEAVEKELIGMSESEADNYFQQCIDASFELMQSGIYGLYKPDPESAEEAAKNYQDMFENPDIALSQPQEPIFVKSFMEGSSLTHNYDIWFNPRQTPPGSWQYLGKVNPTLELVETYETYTNSGARGNNTLKTRMDGNEFDYQGFNSGVDYYKYDSPNAIFENLDARFWGTVIAPSTSWKGEEIIIQAGYIKPDGSCVYASPESFVKNGITYYSLGAENTTDFSGFYQDWGRYTKSGFLFKKFLQEKDEVEGAWGKSSNDWIEFRYAEVLLNYAEAAVEMSSATGNVLAQGKQALNDVRHRAAHTDDIELSVENVRKERFVELAFENIRRWDLVRWRVFHEQFDNKVRKGIAPFLDLRESTPKYIFVRINPINEWPKTYSKYLYYKSIPGIGSNGLIQNP
ncbi:Starch-binding associating with outer membrane [Mariniphaga anaerophila]|uniref:Starch-binding associating with outer membrane n=1 Tax=Mariniphaga anaerophila TaxID=1484053 RepID=A0A1M4SKG7_9BACT|nr:RagB/SusD family nutrient uptake outer membrane protein [Mariniphaga anaerophila]SHE32675.1 Starch-binding associating with outer membrane [Mariniphaga anaerophila]